MRRWGRLIAVLALAALLAPLPVSGATHAQDTGDPATALLERYKPAIAIRTHLRICGPGERYVPVPVDTIFGRPDVVLRDASGTVLKVAPTAADLAGGPPDRWIDLPGNALTPGCSYERWFRELDAPISIYGRVVQEGDVVVAQYWEYWVFNQWNDLHESDWEMTQVMFQAPSIEAALATTPFMYAYAQHEGAQYAVPADNDPVERAADGRHIVFASEGSHASYFAAELWFGKSAATGFGCDDSTGPVEVLEPELIVLPAGDDPPTTGPFAWLSYEGHWGEQQPAFANGPTGPFMKQQWAEPVTWVDELGRENAVQVPFASSPATGGFCRLTQYGSALFNRVLDRPWLILGISAIVLAAVAVVVLRSSQGVLVGAIRTSWRVRRKLVPAGALVALGVGASYAFQKLLLDLTPIADLTDALGGSSAWAAPVMSVVQGVVLVPLLAWAATLTLAAMRPDVVAGPGAPRRSRKVRTFWILLLLTLTFSVALVLFWPLVLLPSRWIVAPVVASRERGSLLSALGASNRLVAGHWLRSIGMMITMALIASLTAAVGAIVLLLTPLSFAEAGIVTGALTVVLVPYLCMVLVEYHAVLMAAHGGAEEPTTVPSATATAPA
jgi:hypothetical protein